MTSQNKCNLSDLKCVETSDRDNSHYHSEIIQGMIELIPESVMIIRVVKYLPDKLES